MIKYKVRLDMDNTYQVIEIWRGDRELLGENKEEVIYSGSIADCEAFIRLKEGGYLE